MDMFEHIKNWFRPAVPARELAVVPAEIDLTWECPWFFRSDTQLRFEGPDRGRPIVFTIPSDASSRAPDSPRVKNARNLFHDFTAALQPIADERQRFAAAAAFGEWWSSSLGSAGDPPRLVTLRVPNCGRWDIPWELLLNGMRPERVSQTAVVRAVSGRRQTYPDALPDKLKVLALVGDDDQLDVRREHDRLRAIPGELDASVRSRIEIPESIVADPDTLWEQIRDARPHVIWFSGHGSADDGIRLYFRGNRHLTPGQFAAHVQCSGSRPLYCVFMACQLGRGEAKESVWVRPALVEALTNVGVLSVLAMQSNISDRNALRCAARLFSDLASGLPLEWAAAGARQELYYLRPEDDFDTNDWATLTVWSTGSPATKLRWGDSKAALEDQRIGRNTLRGEDFDPKIAAEMPDAPHRQTAARIAAGERIWFHDDPIARANLRDLALIVKATQQIQERPMLWVRMQGDHEPQDSLRAWAAYCYRDVGSRSHPSELAAAIEAIQAQTERAWADLVQLPNVLIAVSDPPGADHTWFWNPFVGTANPVAVLAARGIPADQSDAWKAEAMNAEHSADLIREAVVGAPRLVRLLAVLNRPLPVSWLNQFALELALPTRFDDWRERNAVTVLSGDRPLITATARRVIFDDLGIGEDYRTAVLDCLQVIRSPRCDDDPSMQIRRMELLVEAGNHAAAVLEAENLLDENSRNGRWARVVDVLNHLGAAQGYLTTTHRLAIANAMNKLGAYDRAAYQLEFCDPMDDEQQVRKLAIESEMAKSESNFEKAADFLRQALEICRTSTEADPGRCLLIRQDLARLHHYFEHQFLEAEPVYRAAIRGLEASPGREHGAAIVKRNLAECLWSLGEQVDGPSRATYWADARQTLKEAAACAERFQDRSLEAECYYELSSFANSEAHNKANRRESERYLDLAERTARAGADAMLETIIQAKKFWRQAVAGRERWTDIRSNWGKIVGSLARFEHSWAKRVLLNGRLYAAGFEINEGRMAEAIQLLKANQRFFDEHPDYCRGSDRDRIAETYAGLSLFEPGSGWWALFQSRYPWSAEYLRIVGRPGSARSANDIWNQMKGRLQRG